MKAERRFIEELEEKAREQRKLVETEIIPPWARGLSGWMAVNPWRVIAPLSAIAYGILRMVYGSDMREIILGMFGGF